MSKWLKVGIVILLILAVLYFIFQLLNAPEPPPYRDYCKTANDCSAVTCCHPTEVINSYYAPDCRDIACTEICDGPLDCGAGRIECISNRCTIVSN